MNFYTLTSTKLGKSLFIAYRKTIPHLWIPAIPLLNFAKMRKRGGVVSVSSDDKGLIVTKEAEGGLAKYRLRTPCVVAVTSKANEVRFMDVRNILAAKEKELQVWSAADVGNMDESYMGLAGSPSQNGEVFAIESSKNCRILTGTESEIADQIVSIISGNSKGGEKA